MPNSVHTLFIPYWHPTKLNDLLGHHMKAHRLKAGDRQMIAVFAHQQKIPKAKAKRSVGLTIILKPKQRGGDPDSFWKVVLDSLVQASLLKDDNRQWCELLPVKYERSKEWGTRIRLEDIP